MKTLAMPPLLVATLCAIALSLPLLADADRDRGARGERDAIVENPGDRDERGVREEDSRNRDERQTRDESSSIEDAIEQLCARIMEAIEQHPEMSLPDFCTPELPPPPVIGHVVISEVHYDVDATHGVNSGNGNNEWVELYNGSTETVDLSGWKIVDNNATSTLPEGTLLAADTFLIITATSSTAGFWDIPEEVDVIVLGSQIGSGLAIGGDVVFLREADGDFVDAVSWGTNTDAFDPSVPGVNKGHSIARTSLSVDTDSAADWEDREVPSPGM